ncbi:hypothetical protein FPSE_03315 [Fusarium pseudograminearum CS3096]|uniref:2EXR domain-containing protein n=1 Tax=Fusarium pseudograminearum (strain CS3096) TaxID=1028729 RepID=K3W1V4_FUSPC|nr:hypothetical protein FPSE_03315 [Fusarium pseudograminearum CS3096]EKJ76555.1 hypothetical protein FPSE_03315 [Fusarium pseudograminearum CS3096]
MSSDYEEPKLHPGPHLELFNPVPEPLPEPDRNLHNFSSLPPELRIMIWRESLACERLITIGRRPYLRAAKTSPLITTTYVVGIPQYLGLHPALFVNQESREVALSYYRIRIPCISPRYKLYEGDMNGIFYFNPDYDTVLVFRDDWSGSWANEFVKFAQEVQAADTKQLGLRNVAFHAVPRRLQTIAALEKLRQNNALRQVMSGLRSVMFVLAVYRREEWSSRRASSSLRYKRGIPVNGMQYTCFQRVPQDPRPSIQQDLRHNFGQIRENGSDFEQLLDIRSFASTWIHLRRTWKLESPCEHKFSLTSRMRFSCERSDILWILKNDNRIWQNSLITPKRKGLIPKGEETVEELKTAPQTAIGFWIFPVDALGLTPPVGAPGYTGEESEVLDLTAYHPELALSDID